MVMSDNEVNLQVNGGGDQQDYPSAELAYDIAVASYDSLAKRLDTIDGRLQTMLAFVLSVTVAVPSIGGGRGLHFSSVWFSLALLFTVIGVVLGIYARLQGDIQLLNPSRFYQGWLHYSKQEFRTKLIYCAGVDFELNRALVHRKWRYTVWMIILFSLEVACLLLWVFCSHS